ncbi:MAG TPA: hypothetical protein VFU14_20365 [Acidimicrobiales bacterium]|nr:hypothetical protein [Acidimicrobiales bacterium]
MADRPLPPPCRFEGCDRRPVTWEGAQLHAEAHERVLAMRRVVSGLLAVGWDDLAAAALDRLEVALEALHVGEMTVRLWCSSCPGRGPFPSVADLAAHTGARHGRPPTRAERTPSTSRRAA